MNNKCARSSMRLKPPPKRATPATYSSTSPTTYADSGGLDKTQLRDFLRGYFLAHPKLELVVNIESLEFPVDGLAQAVISVTTVELTDPNRQRLKVEFRRSGSAWQVARADRLVR